jgi:predicted permease
VTWLSRLLRRERLERDLDRELRHHVDEETRRLIAEGLPPDDARRLALAGFGGLEPIREQARDARGTRWLEDLIRDLRYALRLLRRSPVFALAAIGSLAIGIGANTAIFSVVDALLLRPLPVSRPDQLFFLMRTGLSPNQTSRFSHARLLDFSREVPEARFAGMSSPTLVQITRTDSSDLAIGQLVTAGYFDVAGVVPQAGQLFTAADDEGSGRPVLVLSDAGWTRRFARDPRVVGTTIRLNGVPVTIVGVAAPEFVGLTVGDRVDLWVPTTLQHALRIQVNASNHDADETKPWNPQRGIEWLTVLVRVPSAGDVRAVATKTNGMFRREIEQALADAPPAERAFGLRERLELQEGARGLSPLRQSFDLPLRVLMATVALVLLVACANLANLLLARNAARVREITVRLAIGARRGRLIRQLLTESLLLSIAGGALGLAIARWGGQLLLRLASSGPGAVPLSLKFDVRLIGFSLAVAVVTGLLFGLAPALRWSRPDLSQAMRASARIVGTRQRFARTLVVVQVALALALLIGAAMFLRTFRNYLSIDPGFDREHVLSARINPRLFGLEPSQLAGLYDRLMTELRRIPGVRSASLAANGPVTGSQRMSGASAQGHVREPDQNDAILEDFVGTEFFTTISMPIVRGREFTDRDDARAPQVAIVNEAFVRHYFPGQDPIGKRYGYSDDQLNIEIVGVVADARILGLRQQTMPTAYLPIRQHADEYVYNAYVRAVGSVDPLRASLRAAVLAAEPRMAVREVVSLGELTERGLVRERMVSSLVGTFSLLAVAVACLGLYGTVSYSVTRRTNEIGVRLALGATPFQVRWLVLRESALLAVAGCVVGLAVAWPLLRYVQSMLYGLSPRDPATLIGATAALLLVSLVAAVAPAWRASRIDPLTALRID